LNKRQAFSTPSKPEPVLSEGYRRYSFSAIWWP